MLLKASFQKRRGTLLVLQDLIGEYAQGHIHLCGTIEDFCVKAVVWNAGSCRHAVGRARVNNCMMLLVVTVLTVNSY